MKKLASSTHHSLGLKDRAITFWVAIAAILFWPDSAHAQTVGSMVCHVVTELKGGAGWGVAQLFIGIAYILGAAFVGNGLYMFKEYADSPGRPPLHQPIMRCIGGATLLALPNMIGWLFTTLYLTPGGGGLTTCSPAASPVSTDPSVWFTNFVDNIKDPLTIVVSVLGYIIGALLMVRGFVKLSKFGVDPRAYSLPAILANLMIGAIIFSMSTAAAFMMNTIFGTATIESAATANVTSWKMVTAFGGSPQFAKVITAAIHFFQLIGAISFLRGWLILKNAAEGSGQATMAQGFTHVIGGIMAMNMFYVLKAFDTTLGTNLL